MRYYPYECENCGNEWDVYKNLSDIEREERCKKCDTVAIRRIAPTHFYGADDWDKAEFNPAFGKVIKNKQHRAEEAKRRGMIEIGNESHDKMCDSDEKERQRVMNDRYDRI